MGDRPALAVGPNLDRAADLYAALAAAPAGHAYAHGFRTLVLDVEIVRAAVEVEERHFVGPTVLRRQPGLVAAPEGEAALALGRHQVIDLFEIVHPAFQRRIREEEVVVAPAQPHDAAADLGHQHQLQRSVADVPAGPAFVSQLPEADGGHFSHRRRARGRG